MGTNYYAIPKITDEVKKEIIEKINIDDFENAKKLMPEKIHVGKSSSGWKFLFNHNNWQYFNKTLEDLELFLKSHCLIDEYDNKITYEDFWEKVKSKENGINNKEYYTNWEKYNKDFITKKPLSKPDYIPKNFGEEYHFGLRFSDCIEFC